MTNAQKRYGPGGDLESRPRIHRGRPSQVLGERSCYRQLWAALAAASRGITPFRICDLSALARGCDGNPALPTELEEILRDPAPELDLPLAGEKRRHGGFLNRPWAACATRVTDSTRSASTESSLEVARP